MVVSYRNSTSNHNDESKLDEEEKVVSYRNSTSNHNLLSFMPIIVMLYLIEILHQTTTLLFAQSEFPQLYLIEILHQTTTRLGNHILCNGLYLIEILHQTTTRSSVADGSVCCILSKFYIKPQRAVRRCRPSRSCILSKFYIKPQLSRQWLMVPCVVSYRNSTSNHNVGPHID